jgi:broad specificity polyphosphatase/5'/3'-nucleotidase SurE
MLARAEAEHHIYAPALARSHKGVTGLGFETPPLAPGDVQVETRSCRLEAFEGTPADCLDTAGHVVGNFARECQG